jgi:hypothetical protein
MRALLLILLLGTSVWAKPKVITFGKWSNVQWMVGSDERQAVTLRVRPLIVNGQVKEQTIGDPHDITDRVFVVQRALKVNDRLPGESKPQWTWRPAGWLMVDRSTAHITKLTLPDYDPFASSPLWFRDYVAYCGLNNTGDKLFAIVYQVGRRQPVLRKLLGPAKNVDTPNAECESPVWQRQPLRVTFQQTGGAPISYAIRNFATEIPPEPAAAGNSEDSAEGQ